MFVWNSASSVWFSPTLSRWCWRTSWEQSFINAFYFINACHSGCMWFQMEPCVTDVAVRMNAVITGKGNYTSTNSGHFSDWGWRHLHNFCFSQATHSHWGALEGKEGGGGEVAVLHWAFQHVFFFLSRAIQCWCMGDDVCDAAYHLCSGRLCLRVLQPCGL